MSQFGPKVCLVCDDRSDGYHFGVYTCRACAAFFRRSISMKKTYRCRMGSRDCEINKSVRNMCRNCRFKKCLEVGMRMESVQNQRDSIGKRSFTAEDRVYEKSSQIEIPEAYRAMFTTDSCFPNASSTSDESMMPTLYRIRRAYEQFSVERSRIHPVHLHQRPGHYSTTASVWDSEVPLIVTFVEKAFDESLNLPSCQRWLLFRSFFVAFIITDGSFRTCQQHDRNDRWILPTNEYIDINDPSHYFHNQSSDYSKEQVSEMLRPSMHLLVRNMLIPLRELEITLLEYCGLMGLLLWNHGIEGQNEHCERIGRQMRDRITLELCYYYKEVLKIPCYALRLSNLLMMVPCVQRMTVRFKEDAEMGKLFQIYDLGKRISDLINVAL